MKDALLKSKLSKMMESVDEVMIDAPAKEQHVESTYFNPLSSATAVMITYQNANKWLDIIKEHLLMDCGCIFFSTYIHNLAHKMPVEFDKFGDILHTAYLKVPYPATEYIPYQLTDMESCFNAIFETLGSINESLRGFIKLTADTNYHSMSCTAEELLVNIDSELTSLYRMQRVYSNCGDITKFDAWVGRYVDHLDSVLG